MSNVNVTIGGRAYTVACAPGEEAHLRALGDLVENRLRAVPGLASQSEVRRLLYATLVLADELHEAREQLDRQAADPVSDGDDPAIMLEQLASRLEGVADRLDKTSPD
ncbi:cell division protein ZapA [Croceibacterium ferulae]|uniref:cell division protein ZapA n=1 Tax=Croceibacterium ferulae TaxID=1854641 RepID=UPI000EACD64B|nr:cell division protein ZapA [Croceibacterium ferulae]